MCPPVMHMCVRCKLYQKILLHLYPLLMLHCCRYAGCAYDTATAAVMGQGKLLVKGIKAVWRQSPPLLQTTLNVRATTLPDTTLAHREGGRGGGRGKGGQSVPPHAPDALAAKPDDSLHVDDTTLHRTMLCCVGCAGSHSDAQ